MVGGKFETLIFEAPMHPVRLWYNQHFYNVNLDKQINLFKEGMSLSFGILLFSQNSQWRCLLRSPLKPPTGKSN